MVFEAAQAADSDMAATEGLRSALESLSVTYARVNLAERTDFQNTLVQMAEQLGYRGPQATQIFINGTIVGTATEACALHESGELGGRIPP